MRSRSHDKKIGCCVEAGESSCDVLGYKVSFIPFARFCFVGATATVGAKRDYPSPTSCRHATIHSVSEKRGVELFAITSSTVNRFGKFFQR